MSTHTGERPTRTTDRLWQPDNDDGSGWAEVDWSSPVRGSRYHYRHVPAPELRNSEFSPYYEVITWIGAGEPEVIHENSYYVAQEELADFLMEMSLWGGEETIRHIEPCVHPPTEAHIEPERFHGSRGQGRR